jgi:hypothetical protein
MSRLPLPRIVVSILLVLATTLAVSAQTPRARTGPQARAVPAPSYDGRWSVTIITDAGACDRTSRHPLLISGGRIYYEGQSSIALNGQVDRRGNVVVNLRYGESAASGVGRLDEEQGQGRWQGVSGGSGCSGRWVAERR